MTEPKSQCNCIDCNLPDLEIESLRYEPPKSSPATEENLTPVIESKTKVENNEVVGQPLEQPNQNLIIVKTIQGLMTCVCNSLYKLDRSVLEPSIYQQHPQYHKLVSQALEETDSFKQTTLELQKAFE